MTGDTDAQPTIWVRRELSPITMVLAPGLVTAQLRWGDGSLARRIRGAAVVAGIFVVMSTVRVVVNSRGFEVGFGPWGWPRRRIPLDRIASARVEQLSPLYYGFGFGYRVVPGRSRVVLRPGPGVVVEMTDGNSFGVTVRDADRAVELINDLKGGRPGG